jgi:hypothetical protein
MINFKDFEHDRDEKIGSIGIMAKVRPLLI